MSVQKQLSTKHKSAVSIHLKISCLRISGCAWCSIFRQKTSISFTQESFLASLFFPLFLFPPKIWTIGCISCYSVVHEGKLCFSSPSTWKLARPTGTSAETNWGKAERMNELQQEIIKRKLASISINCKGVVFRRGN